MNVRPAVPTDVADSPPPFVSGPAGLVRLQVAFFTGPVPAQSPALSPQQLRFLAGLPRDPALRCVARDFPYTAGASAWRSAPLWRASLRNVANFLHARSTGFATTHAPGLRTLLASADHTLLLAGSCGLELLAGLRLPPALLRRVSVLAYGPVARRPFPAVAELRIARGSRDVFAAFTCAPADLILPCGHLGYLVRPEFTAWCAAWIRCHLARPTHAATF